MQIAEVTVGDVAMDGGHKSVAVGLAGYRSLKHHHNVHTMLHSKSYMDPREGHSAINDSVNRMGRLLKDAGVKIFQIETTLNTDTFPPPFDFLMKREWEWSAKDRALFLGSSKSLAKTPGRIARQIFHSIKAPHAMTRTSERFVENRKRRNFWMFS